MSELKLNFKDIKHATKIAPGSFSWQWAWYQNIFANQCFVVLCSDAFFEDVVILMMTIHLLVEVRWCCSQSLSSIGGRCRPTTVGRTRIAAPHSWRSTKPPFCPAQTLESGTTQSRHQTHSTRTTDQMLSDFDQNPPTKVNIAFWGWQSCAK